MIDSDSETNCKSDKPYKFSLIRFLKEFCFVLIIALIFNFVIKSFLLGNYIVDGASMEPTFHSDDMLFVDEISYRFKEPERGDIIVFRPPIDPDGTPYIKRVICLPGETCKVEDGQVYVCNEDKKACKALDEKYLPTNTITTGDDITTVGPNEVYVLGDNRGASSDSRYFGTVSKNLIIGKLLVKYWPL